jgi:hypothetical protein
MTTTAEADRMRRIKLLGVCMACRQKGFETDMVEIHHLNLDGKAGQKRRGHRFTIGLCSWHHRGVYESGHGLDKDLMTQLIGPPLTDSRKFRFWFGTDDELLATQDRLLGVSNGP